MPRKYSPKKTCGGAKSRVSGGRRSPKKMSPRRRRSPRKMRAGRRSCAWKSVCESPEAIDGKHNWQLVGVGYYYCMNPGCDCSLNDH